MPLTLRSLFTLLFGASMTQAAPSTITLPATGAAESGVYRNLFVELGKSEAQVDAKVDAAFQQLFFGTANQKVYYEVGTDMAYIKAIDSDDIRSEGMSYGMMIAVQMNRQDVFDKLWKFAKTYMQHADGDRKGYFSWQLATSEPYEMKDPNPAPDGEEYFAMSLFFAAHRFGDKEGLFAYSAEANAILNEMVRKTVNASVVPLMNPEHKMVEFSPDINSERFTDPSYHLPSYYILWSEWATENRSFWKAAADTSRLYFHRACHPLTGLATEYQQFDGTPQTTSYNANSATFSGDSWRVAMNIAMDYAWFQADAWQVEQSVRLLTFFNSQGAYKSGYQQDGSAATVTYQSEGHVAMNAVAALASNDPLAWKFVEAAWNKPIATGTYRYYNGLLQMLGLLHCAGKFKIWAPAGGNTVSLRSRPQASATPEQAPYLLAKNGQVEVHSLQGMHNIAGQKR